MAKPFYQIPVAKPLLDEREASAATRAILSGWVTQGPEVAAFEAEFAALVGAPFACAVSSCTTALHMALRAVGVEAGDEVITVSHSFIASANVVRYCDAIPVFVDIEPTTFNIDPTQIEWAITRRTRAILCVHQMGMPCNVAAILTIARKYDLPVIEDAACAVGSQILWAGEWQQIGRPHSDIACFSFHPRKLITTGDGGMITTADETWNQLFRKWRQHAMDIPDTVRHRSAEVVFESYSQLGYNYRLTDIQAAIGREQLKRLPEMVAQRRSLVDRYCTMLADVAGVVLPEEPIWARSNWQSFCIRLTEGLDQRRVMQLMLNAGVATRRGIMCTHREPAYAYEPWSCGNDPKNCGCQQGSCQRLCASEQAQDTTIILPLYHQLTENEQDYIVATLARACAAS